jgi:flagellar biogenesis protein FliO
LAWARRWLSAWFPGWRSRPARQLRLRETLALGERRFLAVVEFEQQRFLIGGTGSSVALLSHLPDACRGDEDKDKDEDAGRK